MSEVLAGNEDRGRGMIFCDVQVFDILEAVAQIAEKGMVEVFEHPSFTDDVAHALRPYHYAAYQSLSDPDFPLSMADLPTFIFAYVFQRKGQASILPLDNSHFAKGTLADHSE